MLTINFADDYTEKDAITHVRRLLDIVACTTTFGPKVGRKETGPKEGEVENGKKEDKGEIDMSPPPRLAQFYDFFSFSHLTPPIQC